MDKITYVPVGIRINRDKGCYYITPIKLCQHDYKVSQNKLI